MLPRRVVEDGEINLAFTCASNEGICTFENLWGVASGPHEKERRQIEGFALERADTRPFADRIVVQRSFSIEDPEVPDSVKPRGAGQPLRASHEERRETEQTACREDPETDAVGGDSKMFRATAHAVD